MAKKNSTITILTILVIILLLSTLYLIVFAKPVSNFITNIKKIDVRSETIVSLPSEIVDKLNNEYKTSDTEYFFCLIGEKQGNIIKINSLFEPTSLNKTKGKIEFLDQDPPCQIANSIGSIHSHPQSFKYKEKLCSPSADDLFTFGEMKNPEPLIMAIQCGNDKFYILETPAKGKGLNGISLEWGKT